MAGNDSTRKKKYSKVEYDAAIDYATFLYNLWRKHREDEIIKMDKTISINKEGPLEVN